MNRQQDIRTLTERFLDGETTLQEERTLYQLYAEGPVPDDLAAYRDMMLGFKALANAPSKERRSARSAGVQSLDSFLNLLPKPLNSLKSLHLQLKYRYLLAACLSLIVAWGVWHYRSLDGECVAYVYGERVTDEAVVMQELQLAIGSLSDDGASEAVETQLKDLFE